MKNRQNKSYIERIGKIKWRYDEQRAIWEGKLVGNKSGRQVNLKSTILILLRDLLRVYTDELTVCPPEYVGKAGDIDMGCDLWAEEIIAIADKCDFCAQNSSQLINRICVDEKQIVQAQEKTLSAIMDWLKVNLYKLQRQGE